jgi:hypothetical protein
MKSGKQDGYLAVHPSIEQRSDVGVHELGKLVPRSSPPFTGTQRFPRFTAGDNDR